MLKNCYLSKADFHDFFELPKCKSSIIDHITLITDDLLKYQLSEFKPCRLGG
jgi:hypothetical protein